jgi:hypothetical protein
VVVNQDNLIKMKQHSENWDVNTFLPLETHNWCQDFFASINFCPDTLSFNNDVFSPFYSVYLQLHTALQSHIDSGEAPILSVLSSPTGAEFNQNWNSVQAVDLETDQDN